MNLKSCMKKATLIFFILSVFARPLSAAEKERYPWTDQELKRWLGKKVNVDYKACDSTGCVVVRSAVLKDVTEDAIVVIVNGSPFLIPKHMLTTIELSK